MRNLSSMKGNRRRKGGMPKIAEIPPIQPSFRAPAFPATIIGREKANSKASGLLTDPSLQSLQAPRRPKRKGGKI